MKNTIRFFNSLLLAGTLVFGFRQATAQVDCSPIHVNLSTGIDNAGNILPVGTPDPNWQNTQGYGNVAAPNSGWASLTGSAWLGNGVTGTINFDYVYTRSFSLPSAGTLSFQALGDNYVTILLDGNQIAQTPGMSIQGFQLANVVNYSGPVTAGTHTLQAVVHNQGGPSGLNLSGSVSYIPAPVTFNISTASGGTLPNGATDPHWTNAQGFNVALPPYSGWDVLSGSGWLGNWSNPPAGTYTYTRVFTTYGPGSITFEALADNRVVIELDGVPIAQTPGSLMNGYKLVNLVTYNGFLSAGSHVLDARVYNQSLVLGFNLHGSVSYCSGTEPIVCDVDPDFTVSGALPFYTVNFSSSGNPVNTPGPLSNITHSWSFGDSYTSTAASPSHTYAAAGTYTVTHTIYRQVLNEDGEVLSECRETRSCKLTITAARVPVVTLNCGLTPPDDQTRSAAAATGVFLYPNPARTELIILSNGTAFDVSIFSLDGREVLQRRGLGGTQATIDIAGLPAGSYLARIYSKDGTSNLRFIKVQ